MECTTYDALAVETASAVPHTLSKRINGACHRASWRMYPVYLSTKQYDRELIADLGQEGYVRLMYNPKAHECMAQYQHAKTAYEREECTHTLVKLAYGCVRNAYREEMRTRARSVQFSQLETRESITGDDSLTAEEMLEELAILDNEYGNAQFLADWLQFVCTLTRDEQTLTRYLLEGLSGADIAKQLHVRKETALDMIGVLKHKIRHALDIPHGHDAGDTLAQYEYDPPRMASVSDTRVKSAMRISTVMESLA